MKRHHKNITVYFAALTKAAHKVKCLGVEFVLEFSILLRVLDVFIILIFYLINIKIAFRLCRSLDHLMSVRLKVCRYLLALLFASRCALETHTNEKQPLCFEIRSTAQPEAKDPASGVKPWKRGTASGTCGWSGPIVSVSSSGSAGSGDKTFPLNAAIFQLFLWEKFGVSRPHWYMPAITLAIGAAIASVRVRIPQKREISFCKLKYTAPLCAHLWTCCGFPAATTH